MGFAAALAYALLMNAIPLADVLWHGRSPAALLLLFWFETLLMFVTGAVRIVVHRRATRKTGHYAPTGTVSRHDAGVAAGRPAPPGHPAPPGRGAPPPAGWPVAPPSPGHGNTYLRHFVALTAVFTVAHGLFVLSLVFLFGVGGPLPWADAQAALLWAIAVQVGFLLVDLVHLRAWTFAQLNESCGNATIRVLVTQLGLIFGIPAIGVTGSAWGMTSAMRRSSEPVEASTTTMSAPCV